MEKVKASSAWVASNSSHVFVDASGSVMRVLFILYFELNMSMTSDIFLPSLYENSITLFKVSFFLLTLLLCEGDFSYFNDLQVSI